jgi:hypothetical protein
VLLPGLAVLLQQRLLPTLLLLLLQFACWGRLPPS